MVGSVHGAPRISVSGSALVVITSAGLLRGFLANLGLMGGRVTRLDVKREREVPPWRAFEPLYYAWKDEYRVPQFGRKSWSADRCNAIVGLPRYPVSRTCVTGSFYAPAGRAQAVLKYCGYDRRQKIIVKGGGDPGFHWWRDEFRVNHRFGVTLQDAWEPAPLFWHCARGLDIARPVPPPAIWCRGTVLPDFPANLPRSPRARVLAALDGPGALWEFAKLVAKAGMCEEIGELVKARCIAAAVAAKFVVSA